MGNGIAWTDRSIGGAALGLYGCTPIAEWPADLRVREFPEVGR